MDDDTIVGKIYWSHCCRLRDGKISTYLPVTKINAISKVERTEVDKEAGSIVKVTTTTFAPLTENNEELPLTPEQLEEFNDNLGIIWDTEQDAIKSHVGVMNFLLEDAKGWGLDDEAVDFLHSKLKDYNEIKDKGNLG